MARKTKAPEVDLDGPMCDQWSPPRGVCLAIAKSLKVIEYCPFLRAQGDDGSSCVSHPKRRAIVLAEIARDRVATMKAAGLTLAKWTDRLQDPAFVDRLYQAFLVKRSEAGG